MTREEILNSPLYEQLKMQARSGLLTNGSEIGQLIKAFESGVNNLTIPSKVSTQKGGSSEYVNIQGFLETELQKLGTTRPTVKKDDFLIRDIKPMETFNIEEMNRIRQLTTRKSLGTAQFTIPLLGVQ